MEKFFRDNCLKNFVILNNLAKNGKFDDINQLIFETKKIIGYKIELNLLDTTFSLLGRVVPKSGGFTIYLNRNMDNDLYRFVLGHEIGHILNSFEYTRPWPTIISYIENLEEKICDYIGLELSNSKIDFLNKIKMYEKLSNKRLIDELVLNEYVKRNNLRM
ncbi:MAG: hypothetical protein U0469_02275 [Candidatus Paceibacterota bacterium]|jgi:Zn-dependent peptidase ImmA (M78 family)